MAIDPVGMPLPQAADPAARAALRVLQGVAHDQQNILHQRQRQSRLIQDLVDSLLAEDWQPDRILEQPPHTKAL
eukprot:7382082-Prymnesium_polylepis.1